MFYEWVRIRLCIFSFVMFYIGMNYSCFFEEIEEELFCRCEYRVIELVI